VWPRPGSSREALFVEFRSPWGLEQRAESCLLPSGGGRPGNLEIVAPTWLLSRRFLLAVFELTLASYKVSKLWFYGVDFQACT